jgi:hypothetical protein
MKKFLSHAILFSLISIPLLASAQAFGLQNPIGVNSISELIVIVVKVIRYIAIPFVVIMIMYAGYLYLYAGYTANKSDLEGAHNAIYWVVVGSFVILSAEMIALVISNTLNSAR